MTWFRRGIRMLGPCCLVLVVVGCGKSTAHWTAQAKADDPVLRLEAIRMLQERTGESTVVVPVLIDALQDNDHYVRRDAARALAKFGDNAKPAVDPLVARLKDAEPSVRKAAAQSLQQIDPAAAAKAGVPAAK